MFREQAARCRRIAEGMGNRREAEKLLDLALEYEKRAFHASIVEGKGSKDLG